MNVREAIETIGMQRLAGLAGCTRTTIDRTKQRGDVSSSPTGARIRQAIRGEGIALDGDVPAGGEQPDLPMETPLAIRLNQAKLEKAEADAAEKQRKNAEAEARLLPADEVASRIGHGGRSCGRGWTGCGVRLRRSCRTSAGRRYWRRSTRELRRRSAR